MEDQTLPTREIIAILNRRKTEFFLPFACVFLVSCAVAFLLPPTYKSTATILIEQREIPAVYVTSSITTFAEQRIQSIQQRILTSSRLLELVNRFDLYSRLKKRKTRDEIVEEMREDILLEPVNVEIADRHSGRSVTATIAFSLSYENENPKKAQQVAGTITDIFLKEDIKVRKEQASSAYDFLFTETDKLQAQIDRAERDIAAFKQENVLCLPEMFQLNARTLDSTTAGIDQARETLRSLKEKKESLRDELAHTPEYMEDTLYQKSQKDADTQRLEQLRIQLVNLETRYGEKYPDIKSTRREIQTLESKIGARQGDDQPDLRQKNPAYVTLSARLAGLVSDITSVENQIRELKDKAEVYRVRLDKTPMVEKSYNAMLADRKSLYAKNAELQAKMMEASVAREFESKQKGERFSLIEAAQMPEAPDRPNRLAITLVGLVLGLGSGIAAGSFLEFSDTSFRTGQALAKTCRLPLLAEIPVIVTAGDRRRRKIKRIAASCAGLGLTLTLALLFHVFVLDFSILQARIMRTFFNF